MGAQEPLDMKSPGAGEIAIALDARRARAPIAGGFNFILLIVVAIALALSFGPAEMGKAPLLVTDSEKMGTYLSGFLRPDFSQWDLYFEQIVITIQIALWGTFLAVVAAVPFGLLSARNVAPVWIVQPARRLMDLFRSINELVIATIFIVAAGLGPFAGVMALAVHTTGVLAKLFSEAVEAIEPGPVEGVRATGASRIQEVVWGVIPQVLPLWSSFALYRFESNARSSTVLGIIGAGGIGALLMQNIRSFNYERTAAIVILMVGAVIIIDNISQAIRKRLV
jgi:phosphonate transport system permease protein